MNLRIVCALLFGWSVLANGWSGMAQTNVVPPALSESPESTGRVFVIPIRDDIMPPLVYVVRRGVKEAMEANAEAIILDMETNGGRVDTTQEIIQIINKFPGKTITYVNDKAFSAGAFIAVATEKIFMAPQSVIGAAAPIMMSPGGSGVEKLNETFEAKMTSAVRALVRTQAEKNGHNVAVVEAMIDKTKRLEIDGDVLNEEGSILTLTDRQAAKEYGSPPQPLLSAGTVESLDTLIQKLGYSAASRTDIQPTGAEKLGSWINKISPLLLIIGIIGLYIEFKTPGFGLPGIVGITAFAIYFLGGYVAGLSGAGWILVFLFGIALIAVELFVIPGTFVAGILGAILILVALIMGMVDVYPGTPKIPSLPDLRQPLQDLSLALLASVVLAVILARFLPKTALYGRLVSQSVSGEASVAEQEAQFTSRIGKTGVATTHLLPGGKARFDDELLDVMTRGERVEKGSPVRIIGYSGSVAIVEAIT